MAENPAHTNLYVRHLPLEWTKEQMNSIFAPYGHILSSKLLMDANAPNTSRGMGFVRFVNHADAVNACSGMDGYIPEGSHKALSVKFAKDQQQGRGEGDPNLSIAAAPDTLSAAQAPSASGLSGDDKNLYVRDLPLTFTKEEFHKMYEPYGELVSSTVLCDPTTGISRGIGFARYAEHDSAVAGLKATDGMMLPGAIKPIIVQFARDTSRKGAGPPPGAQGPPPGLGGMPPMIPTMMIDPTTGIPYIVPMPFFPPHMMAAQHAHQAPAAPAQSAAAQAAASSPFANIPAPLPVTASGITTMPSPPPGAAAPAPAADPYAAYYAYAGYGGAAAQAPAAAPVPAPQPPPQAYPPPQFNPYAQPPQYPPYGHGPPPQAYGYPGHGPPPHHHGHAPPMGRGAGGGPSVRYSPYGGPPHRGRH